VPFGPKWQRERLFLLGNYRPEVDRRYVNGAAGDHKRVRSSFGYGHLIKLDAAEPVVRNRVDYGPVRRGYTRYPHRKRLLGHISLKSLTSAGGWKMILGCPGCPGCRGLTSRQYKIYNSTYEAGNKGWRRASGDILGRGYLDHPYHFR
jgi:hypothetical protein